MCGKRNVVIFIYYCTKLFLTVMHPSILFPIFVTRCIMYTNQRATFKMTESNTNTSNAYYEMGWILIICNTQKKIFI